MLFPEPKCPHCGAEVRLRSLPHPSLFGTYRVCPACGERFTTDRKTKHRQALFLLSALISLVLTIALYLRGVVWLAPALISYAVLGVIFYRGNRQIRLVP